METKIRVRLDTRQAKSDLNSLTREGIATAGRVGSRLRGAVGAGLNRSLGAIGLGGGVGAGLAAVRGATESSFGDVIGEAFGGFGEEFERDLGLQNLGEQARASKSAREETIAAFALQAGQLGRVPPGAKAYFDQIRQIRAQEEAGRNIFEDPANGFRGPGVGEVTDRLLEGVGNLLSEAVDALANKLKS